MSAVAKPCPVGARGVDSLPFSQGGTAAQAHALKAAGVDFVALYLGVASKAVNDACLAAGLSTFGVTIANRFDGKAAVAQMKALGMPVGTTAFLDVEGTSAYNTPAGDLIAKINSWANDVAAAGYIPGIYLGSPQPLTSEELTNLRVVRYWRAPARVVDRHGALAEPSPGWCMYQVWPSVTHAGVFVDFDFVSQDFKGRVPAMASL